MTEQPQRPDEAALDTGSLPSTTGVAVSPHLESSRAAIRILDAGGSAADAAIAAIAVQGVVAFETCGIGGDLFALVHEPGEPAPTALNASGRCGSGWSAVSLRAAGLSEIPIDHPASVTVPGCVDGFETLRERHGRLPLAQLLEPAIERATDGFVVSPELATTLETLADVLAPQPSADPFYPDGQPASAGTRIARPDLGATLTAIAESGVEAFYGGRFGDAIVEATDGGITRDDLATRQAEWVEPLSTQVFGYRGWTIPPNSQGYITLATAWLIEQLQPPADITDPVFHHSVIEAFRAICWERDDLVSDPGTAPMDPEALLAPARLEERLAAVSSDSVAVWPAPADVPGGTAYLCVRDGDGMGVSLIQSNYHGVGARIGAGDTGVFLHDRGAGFNLIDGHHNELRPGRRPLHTLSPTLWTDGTRLRMLLGTRGGQYQPQLLAQYVAARLWAGLSPQESQQVPRWQVDGWEPGGNPAVTVENRLDEAVIAGLRDRGHDVNVAEAWRAAAGPISHIEAAGDAVVGAADPRVSTTAALHT